jgi:hypothetical protein
MADEDDFQFDFEGKLQQQPAQGNIARPVSNLKCSDYYLYLFHSSFHSFKGCFANYRVLQGALRRTSLQAHMLGRVWEISKRTIDRYDDF